MFSAYASPAYFGCSSLSVDNRDVTEFDVKLYVIYIFHGCKLEATQSWMNYVQLLHLIKVLTSLWMSLSALQMTAKTGQDEERANTEVVLEQREARSGSKHANKD